MSYGSVTTWTCFFISGRKGTVLFDNVLSECCDRRLESRAAYCQLISLSIGAVSLCFFAT